MPEEIPRAIRDAAAANHRELLALEKSQRAKVDAALTRVLDALASEINGAGASAFRDVDARIIGALAASAQARSLEELDILLRDSLAMAFGLAPDHAINEINNWIEHHGGAPRPLNLRAAAAAEEELLIERYQPSLATYGAKVADRIKTEVVRAVLARPGRESVVDAVQDAIQGERYRAARIVRTETMNAYNAAHNAALMDARDSGQVPGLKKSAIVTFDARTDADSLPLSGQVRELEEDFVDGDGRRYLHPPGRPNDREKEIPWLDDLDPILVEPPDRAEEIRAERAEAQAELEANASEFEQRRQRFATSWDQDAYSRESVKMTRAAADAFGLPGLPYTPRAVDVPADEQAQAVEDARRIYEETQAELEQRGVTALTLRRGVAGELDVAGHLETWTAAELGGEYIEEEVDRRRIFMAPDGGDPIILPMIPRRRFEPADFEIGFFDASEIDPDPRRAGPFGIASNEDDSTSLFHIPTGRQLITGDYSKSELELLSYHLELGGHVDADGRLVGWRERAQFKASVDQILEEFEETRREQRRQARGALEWATEDFEIGFFDASEFDPSAERSRNWGILEYEASEDKPAGAALYHLGTGDAVIDGAFRRADLRELAEQLDPFLDDSGRLPDESSRGYGDFDAEISSARQWYERERVTGLPAIQGVRRYVDVGGIDFPAINDDVQPNTPGKYSRRVMRVLTEWEDGQFEVTEQQGYLRGNFFYYKSRSSFENPNGFEVNDWHIVHAKTGAEIHSGTAMIVDDSDLRIGGWRLSEFKKVGERLEGLLDADGNVRQGAEQKWINEVELLQYQTSPGLDAAAYLGDRFNRDDWVTSPISRRLRARFEESEVELTGIEVLDFLANGEDDTEIDEIESSPGFDDVPF